MITKQTSYKQAQVTLVKQMIKKRENTTEKQYRSYRWQKTKQKLKNILIANNHREINIC